MEAAFFDLDKTVIAKASMVAFSKTLYREGLISRWLLLRALYGQLVYLYLGADEERLARMKDAVLALTKGWEQDRVRAIVEEALTEVVDPIVYAEALDLIHEHQAAGRKVFIVSASPEEIVAPLARHLRVDGFLGTRTEIDEEGRYSGVMAFYCYGPAKAVAMREVATAEGIDLAASYAYSDSGTDIPMLEAVGHPVAVNADRELARAAEEHGWEVRRFANEVRLRDRLPYKPALGVVGGTAAASAASAGVWWWLQRRERHARPTSRSGWRGKATTTISSAARGKRARNTPTMRRTSRTRTARGSARQGSVGRRAPKRSATTVKRRGPSWRQTPRGHRG